MEASIFQIFKLALSIILIVVLTATIYFFSIKKNNYWFMIYVALLSLSVQWLSDLGLIFTFHGYYLQLSSVILFPSVILSIIFAYVNKGQYYAAQIFLISLASNFAYTLNIGILAVLSIFPKYIILDYGWVANHLFSAIALIIDFIIMGYLWPFLHNKKNHFYLWFKIFCIFSTLFIIDTIIFNVGAFWFSPELANIIRGNILVRLSLSILIFPMITIYLKYQIKKKYILEYYPSLGSLSSSEDVKLGQEKSAKIIEIEELYVKFEKNEQELKIQNQILEKQKLAMLNLLEDVSSEKDIFAKQKIDLQKFQLAVENVSDHIVITDIEGIVLYANPAASKITGFDNQEIIGQKAGTSKLWGGLMEKKEYVKLWKIIKEDKKNYSGELTNHRKNGQQYIVESHISPILDQDDNIQFFVAIERDITKAKEVDRMKTDFISIASHQLRTPLSAMKWFLEMLGGGDMGKLNQEQSEAIKNINLSNERMILLVNSLLNISRIESGRIAIDPEPTDIMSIINDVKQEFTPKLVEKQQSLTIDYNNKVPIINLDPKMLRQVLVNILSNAIKYSPVKANIYLKTTLEELNVIVSLSDSGYGIPEKEKGDIFHRFFRASNILNKETDGTGLGLYLCKEIIESMQGKIWFTSKENMGTTFYFSLPLKGVNPKQGEVKLS
ncbi:MAG: ATP-binding protein [bacterium]